MNRVIQKLLSFPKNLHNARKMIVQLISFILLVFLYSFSFLLSRIGRKIHFFKYGAGKIMRMVYALDQGDKDGVSQVYLMEIAFKNMIAKKTRTTITIGGMAIGISFIVFLVSIGYGLQEVVVSRVARLDELQQAEVVPGMSLDLALNDETIAKFQDIKDVERVLPLIAVIGKVSYQDSVSDLAVYGATHDYLKYSALQPIEGRLFESNETVLDVRNISVLDPSEQIAVFGEKISSVSMNITMGEWLKVRESPSLNAKVIGYTKKIEGRNSGEQVWGDAYDSENESDMCKDAEGKEMGKWVHAEFLLWEKKSCNVYKDSECEEGQYIVQRNTDNTQTFQDGYVAQLFMQVTQVDKSEEVLGLNIFENTGTLPVVELLDESLTTKDQPVKTVNIQSKEKEVVVNQSVLQLINIAEKDAVGKVIRLSLVVVGELLEDPNIRVESAPLDYTIVGVIPDEGTPIVYLPFLDVRSLGVSRYSQVKVIAKTPQVLRDVRTTIESLGYGTVSVADTVAQIDSLFSNFRLLLSILGLVALSVAALGMFNTLTVSLLERTREVGLMKAMGLKSDEVKALFLTESMIMGLYGGLFGLILGIIAGKVVSLILSALSIVKGVGFVDVSYVPLSFIVFVLSLSVFVGILTGYYPAKRATKISALNALRYE